MCAAAIPVVTPPREITEASLSPFEQELAAHVAGRGPGVVLDLLDVEFINSAGLGMLVKVGMRLDGQDRRLVMARAASAVEKTIRLLGLDRKMPMFRTVEEALAFVAALPVSGGS